MHHKDTKDRIEPIHEAQLLTYLRLTNLWLGLLINFNVAVLKIGIKRSSTGSSNKALCSLCLCGENRERHNS